MALKVVIENAFLKGSQDESMLQRVATVYPEGGGEFRVLAPPKATGDALDWLKQWQVRQPDPEPLGFGGEIVITDGRSGSVVNQVVNALEQRKLESDIWNWGEHPDARFYAAQICMRGHVQSADGKNKFNRDEHCQQCGDPCIDSCQKCKAPIRGGGAWGSPSDYVRPSFCYKCGRPYPWMEDCLATARELLWHDDKLDESDREKLWRILQYVMSDPKSDLVPAKKKLFEIGIGKALPATREFFLDLMAKLGAEMLKS
jgi:hypothetical protein